MYIRTHIHTCTHMHTYIHACVHAHVGSPLHGKVSSCSYSWGRGRQKVKTEAPPQGEVDGYSTDLCTCPFYNPKKSHSIKMQVRDTSTESYLVLCVNTGTHTNYGLYSYIYLTHINNFHVIYIFFYF